MLKGVKAFKTLHDIPDLVPGELGKSLFRREKGNAATVVAGEFGKGRVVLLAPNLGAGARNMEQPPRGHALQLLLNAVEWAADGGNE